MPLGVGHGLIERYQRNVFFVHNNLLALYSGLLKQFSDFFDTNFYTYSISTYETFLQNIEQKYEEQQNNDDEYFQPILPALSIDPLGDISIPPEAAQLWRLPYLEGGANFAASYFMNTTNIKTEHFRMVIVPIKYKISMEATVIADSQTKMSDLYNQTILMFHGGFNRPIRLSFIESDLILPTALMEEIYVNDVTGEQIVVYDEMKDTDFNPNTEYPEYIGKKVIKQLGGMELYYIPWLLDPILRFESITLQHDKYSTEAIHKWGFSFNFNCEVHVPSFIILETDYQIKKIDFTMRIADNADTLIPGPKIEKQHTFISSNPNNAGIAIIEDFTDIFNIIPANEISNKELINSDETINVNDDQNCNFKFLEPFKTFRIDLDRDVNPDNPLIYDILDTFHVAEFRDIILYSVNRNKLLDFGDDFYPIYSDDNKRDLKIQAELEEGDILYLIFYK